MPRHFTMQANLIVTSLGSFRPEWLLGPQPCANRMTELFALFDAVLGSPVKTDIANFPADFDRPRDTLAVYLYQLDTKPRFLLQKVMILWIVSYMFAGILSPTHIASSLLYTSVCPYSYRNFVHINIWNQHGSSRRIQWRPSRGLKSRFPERFWLGVRFGGFWGGISLLVARFRSDEYDMLFRGLQEADGDFAKLLRHLPLQIKLHMVLRSFESFAKAAGDLETAVVLLEKHSPGIDWPCAVADLTRYGEFSKLAIFGKSQADNTKFRVDGGPGP